MQETQDPFYTMRKRLQWRASHRGIKEMDILVGGFAIQRLPFMSKDELVCFADILDIPDQDLLSWLTNQSEVPVELHSPLLAEMLQYRPLS